MTPTLKEHVVMDCMKGLKCDLFASRPTMAEAWDYLNTVANASDNPIAVVTACYVVLNTVCNQIIEVLESKDDKELVEVTNEQSVMEGGSRAEARRKDQARRKDCAK